MKVEITYSYGRTKQVEAFTPINIHASIKAELSVVNRQTGETEDPYKAFEELKKVVQTQVNKDIDEAVEALRNPHKGLSEQGPGFNLPN